MSVKHLDDLMLEHYVVNFCLSESNIIFIQRICNNNNKSIVDSGSLIIIETMWKHMKCYR